MNATYTTRNEAIESEIVTALGEYADQHDVDAIADEVIVSRGDATGFGLAEHIDHDAFWAVVGSHALDSE